LTQQLLENAPVPADDAWIVPPVPGARPGGPQPWRLSSVALSYLTRMATNVNLSPAQLNALQATDQSASMANTDLTGGAIVAGLYELRYWATVVQAATVSSSLTVTLTFTYRAVTKTASGAAMTTNTTGTHQSGSLPLFYSDASSPIQISTTYASVGGTPMLYDIFAVLLRVSA
jgi:hypothetical protein